MRRCGSCGQVLPHYRVDYDRVAELYLEAVRDGLPVTKHVAQALGIETGHAAVLIHRARHRYGLLPPAPAQGKSLAPVA